MDTVFPGKLSERISEKDPFDPTFGTMVIKELGP